ncbi:plasmid mobilization relaxosome protein MobC [Mariprofundus ferrooxydans]|nr:plasmid mobilization relaxosome protein MobC [Mariprofundus ferrooxydans]
MAANTEKRTRSVNIRLSETEYNLLRESAFKVDMKPSTFCRTVALSQRIPSPLADRQLLAHVSRVGGNLNQVSHHLNSGNAATKRSFEVIASAIEMTREIRDLILGDFSEGTENAK